MPIPGGLSPQVTVLLVMAVATMAVISLVDWTLLLYLNHISFTHSNETSFYVTTSSLTLLVPVLGNLALGPLSSHLGAGRSLALGHLLVGFGLVIMTFIRQSRLLFLLGYALYALLSAFRIVRMSILSEIVPMKYRTAVIAAHQLMAPIGAIIGPVLWLVLQKWKTRVPLFSGAVVLDRFSVNYALCAFAMFVSCYIAEKQLLSTEESSHEMESLPDESTPVDAVKTYPRYGAVDVTSNADALGGDGTGYPDVVNVKLSCGTVHSVNLEMYRMSKLRFFCGMMVGMRLSATIFQVAFQPILIDVFSATESDVGRIYTLVALMSLIPPLAITLLARVMKDREIIMIGVTLKMVGMALFLPLFGEVRRWQVVAGFILIVKASDFFTTSTMSLFSKVIGRNPGTLMGYLWSAANIGPAVIQIALASQITGLFRGWWFGIFAVPGLFTVCAVLWPANWQMLDPDTEYTQLVVREINQVAYRREKLNNV